MKKNEFRSLSRERKAVRRILFKMRWIAFFLMAGGLSVSASSYSQKTKIDLQMINTPVEKILQSIEKSSEFYFYL